MNTKVDSVPILFLPFRMKVSGSKRLMYLFTKPQSTFKEQLNCIKMKKAALKPRHLGPPLLKIHF